MSATPAEGPAEQAALTSDGPPAFLASVNLVFVASVAGYALAFVTGVILARALGPDGRGVYSLFLLSASLAQAVLSLGIGVSAIYYIGKRAFPLADILSHAQVVVLGSAAVSGVLVLLAIPTVGGRLLDAGAPFWAFAFAVPLYVEFSLLTSVLQGRSRFLEMNVLLLAQPLVLLALLAAGLAGGGIGTSAAVVAWALSVLAASLLGLWLVGPRNLRPAVVLRPKWPVLRRQVTFGAQGQAGNLVQLLNYRLDQYLVLLFVSESGVGLYAVGVSVSETIWFLANAVAVVLLPRLTAAGDREAAEMTPVACRNTLLISALGAVALGVVSLWLVPFVFGHDFSGSVRPLLWLLPGTVALAGSKVLASYVFSRGLPLVNSGITLSSLVVTVAADLALIPTFGVPGAAAASSLAYSAHLALSLLAYQRVSGQPLLGALLPSAEDLRLYRSAIAATTARLRPASEPRP